MWAPCMSDAEFCYVFTSGTSVSYQMHIRYESHSDLGAGVSTPGSKSMAEQDSKPWLPSIRLEVLPSSGQKKANKEINICPQFEPGGKLLHKDTQYMKLEEPRIKVLFTSHPYASQQQPQRWDMLIAEYLHMNQSGEICIIHATEEWRGDFLEPQVEWEAGFHSHKICFPQLFTSPTPRSPFLHPKQHTEGNGLKPDIFKKWHLFPARHR